MLSRVYRRNLLWRQVEMRYRSCATALKLAGLRGRGPRRLAVGAGAVAVFLLDVALGVLVTWLWNYLEVSETVQVLVSEYTLSLLRLTRYLIDWVMGSPWGLKLNAPLGHFLGSRCLSILGLWEVFYHDFLSHYLPSLLSLLPLTSLAGLSLMLALFHDFFKFLNLCFICFHIFSSRLLLLQLSILTSLGRLFAGWKWNVLRRRVDSYAYDTSQLSVGTILFTIFLFLLPTTLVFALLFWSLRLGQWIGQFVLKSLVVCINWSTFLGYHWLRLLDEGPHITSARVEVGRDGEVRVVWGGRRWRVEEMRKIIHEYPVSLVLVEVCGVRQEEEKQDYQLLSLASLWNTL